MNDALIGSRLKVERAKIHRAELDAEIVSFLGSRPYEIVSDFKAAGPDSTDRMYYRVRVNREIPPHWCIIVSDIAHELRSSLDNLICAIVKAKNPTADLDEPSFPISNTKKEFKRRIRGSKVQRILPSDVITFIKRFKPYKRGNRFLWLLHQVNRIDKHQGIMLIGGVVMSYEASTLERNAATYTEIERSGAKGRPRFYPLKDGKIITTHLPVSINSELKGHAQGTFQIAFGKDKIVKGEPVIATIDEFIDLTKNIIRNAGAAFFS